MKTLYLLNGYLEGFYTNPGKIISLTPEVSNELDNKKFNYSIPEDYFGLDLLNTLQADYDLIFSEWIDRLDLLISARFNELRFFKVKAATQYGYYLKLLIDPFIARILMLKAIFEKLLPEKVVFVSFDCKSEPVDWQLFVKGNSIISLILPLFCDEYKFELEEVHVPMPTHEGKNKYRLTDIKRNIKLLSKEIFLKFKYFINHLINSKRFNSDGVLFLSPGRWSKELINFANKNEYRIFFLKDEKYSPPKDLNTCRSLGSPSDYHLEIFDRFVMLKFSDLLYVRINYFLNVICPHLEKNIVFYRELLEEKKITCVIGSNNSRIDQFAMISAAYTAPKVLSVMINHGYSIFYSPFHLFINNQSCNLYLTYLDELKEYFSKDVFCYERINVKTSSLWLTQYGDVGIKNDENRRSVNITKLDQKPVVLYIPTMFIGEHVRLDGAKYTDTWYFRHQKELLEYFASEKDYLFIWKSYKNCDSSKLLIHNNIPKNVRFVTGKLTKYFQSTDFAVLDYPSTPLIETVLSGIPSLAMYHDSLRIRKTALTFWSNITRPFSSTEQAKQIIRSFLRDDPTKYLKKIPINNRCGFETITNFIENERRSCERISCDK